MTATAAVPRIAAIAKITRSPLSQILDTYKLPHELVRKEVIDPPGVEFYLLEIVPAD